MTASARATWACQKSDRIRLRAQQVTPGGVQSSIRGFEPVLAFIGADGARIRDADGNDYLDYHLAFGATLLGHRHPAVQAGVASTLNELDLVGTGVTPPELEICELVVRHVPSAERVLLANSGAEATYHAIRLARAVTGRTKIVKFQGSYHGWHDGVALNTGPGTAAAVRETATAGRAEIGHAGAAPESELLSAGTLPATVRQTLVAEFNDLAGVEQLIEEHRGDIAAVIMEPVQHGVGCILPEPGFLQEVRSLTADSGIILIFDEVITGFRVARGGAQERYGVRPDLTVLSKVMGGGVPVAAFGGSRAAMAMLADHRAMHLGVYAGNHLCVRAVVTMLEKIERSPQVYEQLEKHGDYLEHELRSMFAEMKRPALVSRVGSLLSVSLLRKPVDLSRGPRAAAQAMDFAAHRALQIRAKRMGVYFHPSPIEPWFLSTAHSAEDLDQVVATVRDALADVPESR
jgi:glutamate-1-semialdehyde 2,1-aminomutase